MARGGSRPKSIGTTAAGRLIEKELGLKCSPSALLYHLNSGKLDDAVISRAPYRIDPAVIVTAYARSVHNRTTGRAPRHDTLAKQQAADDQETPVKRVREQWRHQARETVEEETKRYSRRGAPPPVNPAEKINLARMWGELEKARKLQAERLATTGLYVHRSQIQPALEAAFMAVSKRVMGIASKVKAENPALDFSVIESIRRESRDALEGALDGVLGVKTPPLELTEEEEMFNLPAAGEDMESMDG